MSIAIANALRDGLKAIAEAVVKAAEIEAAAILEAERLASAASDRRDIRVVASVFGKHDDEETRQ